MRILIIKPSSLGDVATSLPMLCDLKRAYPAAQIDWLIHPGLAALVEGHDAVAAAIPFDRKRLGAWWYKPSAFRRFRTLLKEIRQAHYDLVVDAQGLFRSGFLARISGAPTRLGFANAREGATLFYTHKARLPDNGRKMLAVERMRGLLKPLEIDTARPAEFRVPIHPAAHQKAATLLPPGRFAAIIPGARWDTKRWSLEGFGEIARRLDSAGLHPVLLGSPDEKALCDTLATALGPHRHVTNLAGQTNLAEMIAVLDRAALVLGNDSGPLHVAVALGKPCVALYGPTDPLHVGPYGQLDHVIRYDVTCHPCRRKTCGHHSCMRGVTVEAVWEKTSSLIQPSGSLYS